MSGSSVDPAKKPTARWLVGPGVDLLAGCGLGYALVFVGLVAAGAPVKEWLPNTLLPLLSLVAGAPHYGATLLRVYRKREDRKRYAAVATGATLVLAVAFLVSLEWWALGSFLVSLYLLWSPWHYSAQNYGLALMFLGRRQVAVDPLTRRVLRSTFILPFLIFILQVNGVSGSSLFGSYAAAEQAMPPAYAAVPIGIPASLQSAGLVGLVAAYLLFLLAAGWRIVRASSLRDAAPALLLMGTQSLWFAIPACARYWGLGQGVVPLEAQSSVYAFHFVAAAHAAQYLWVTIYFNNKAGDRHGGRFYLKSMLAGQALWTVPTFVFAPALGAGLAFSADLALLVAAVVNLHHFVLDGAIWKLRDAKVSSVLVKSTESRAAPIEPRHGVTLRAAAWALGAVVLLVEATMHVERHAFGAARSRGDLAGAVQALDRLDRVGRADSALLVQLGRFAEEAGQPALAYQAYERSAKAQDNAAAHIEIARLHQAKGEWVQAADAFERSYALSDHFPLIAVRSMADTLVRAGRPARAREVLEEGRRRFPGSPELEAQLRALEH